MYEKSLNEAEMVLSAQKEPLSPVRKVWEEVTRRSKAVQFEVASLPDFTALLEGDHRFQIIPGRIKNDESDKLEVDDLDSEEDGMEQLGFYSEDRVRLRNAPVAEQSPGEEEEEVGSIRRRAFVNHPAGVKAIPANGKNGSPPKKPKAALARKTKIRKPLTRVKKLKRAPGKKKPTGTARRKSKK